MIVKKIFQPKTIFVVVAILIGGGMFLILRNTDTGQNQQSNTEIRADEICETDADCVLVQDGWCKTVLAVHKNKETEWKEENAKQAETARLNRQTCELMPAEYLDIGNFRAVCKQSRCVEELIVDN